MDPSTTMQHHWHHQGVKLLHLRHHNTENPLPHMEYHHGTLDQHWNTTGVIKSMFQKREPNVFVTQSLFTLTYVKLQCYNPYNRQLSQLTNLLQPCNSFHVPINPRLTNKTAHYRHWKSCPISSNKDCNNDKIAHNLQGCSKIPTFFIRHLQTCSTRQPLHEDQYHQ